MKKDKKFYIYDELDADGNKIPGTAKRFTKREREEMFSDEVAGEMLFDENEWLNEQIQNLETLKKDITANKYKVHNIIIQYMAGCNVVINHFLEKRQKATSDANSNREQGFITRTENRDKFQKHFDGWRKDNLYPSNLKLFTAYRRSKDVIKFYKEHKKTVPSETTLSTWLK